MGDKGQDKQDFAFIKEKIKDKPINRRRLLIRAAFNVFCAVIFGAVACFVFVWLKPYMEGWLYPQEGPAITFPKDTVPAEEDMVEDPDDGKDGDVKGDSDQNTEKEDPQDQEAPDSKEEGDGTGEDGNNGQEDPNNDLDGEAVGGEDTEEEGKKEPPPVLEKELELKDYQALQDKLYAIGKQANKSVVTVTGVRNDIDWFNTPYENENRSSGIVIGDNGQELLILTEKKVITGAETISITFSDGTALPASLRKYDGNTGIAVISVPLSEIGQGTLEQVEAAPLGNSYSISPGMVVLAVGSPLGTNYSILCGTITSSQNKVSTIDTDYTIFTTDMVGSADGSGVLVSLEGEVVGLVLQDYSNQSDRNTITALSISELKRMIEDLSKDRDVPYVGLRLSTVTDDIASRYGIPKGVYIKSVEMDSPAMMAGVQEADIITGINDEEITSVEQYSQRIYEMEPGDEVKISIKRQGIGEYVELDCIVTVSVLE